MILARHELKKVRRECLQCGDPFLSVGWHNRRCWRCRGDEALGEVGKRTEREKRGTK